MVSLEVLRRFPNFAGLSEPSLKRVARLARMRTFEVGERLFEEGQTADLMMFVLYGEVNIVYQLGNGDSVVADTLVAGEPLAWSSLLEPYTLTAGAVARKAGSLIEIDASGLREMCEEDTEFGYVMMKEVAKTLRTRLSALLVQVAASAPEPAWRAGRA